MYQKVSEQIRGTVYGQAIGDALGLGTEFLTKAEVQTYYPYRLTRYGQILRDAHRRRWPKSTWTDDTDQMLCIFDSLLKKQSVDILDIASRLHQWAVLGGMGIGNTVASTLFSSGFLINPHAAAKKVWEESNRYSAANGGVMRTSILGIWEYWLPERVKTNAEQVCKITHYDPRCVGSCVLVCLTICSLLQGQTEIQPLFERAYTEGALYDLAILEYLDKAQDSLEALALDEGLNLEMGSLGKIGYTLKAMGAGFWALKHATSYEEGILKIIHEGGDADTNAAVAGAMLGARFGFSQLPQKLANGLAQKDLLDTRIEQLLSLS